MSILRFSSTLNNWTLPECQWAMSVHTAGYKIHKDVIQLYWKGISLFDCKAKVGSNVITGSFFPIQVLAPQKLGKKLFNT